MDYSNKSKGLENLGNTCFFNSVLQMLFQCTVLNKLLVENDINGSLINIYKQYLISYIDPNKNSLANPREIVNYVSQILERRGLSQEDADQYITFIIDCIINEFKEWAKKSSNIIIANKSMSLNDLIINLFTIKCDKEIFCPQCDNISKTNDDINKLYLSIDDIIYEQIDNNQSNTLNFLINKYLYETLDNNNKWKCDKCNNMVNATIKRTINKFPKYLIITLKRYSNNNKKNNQEIDMPYNFAFIDKNFYLRGIIYHSGSTNGGHYVYYGNKNNQWYLYNDSSISLINEQIINNIKKLGYIYLYVAK
jgi:ubiquitin C-terminal hydrolase